MVDAAVLLDKYFDVAFAAPDGVERLRELILSLAMRGQLVPQDPNEQPARELLKEIEAEKKRLVKEGKIKKSKPLPDITPDEIPHKIPKNWQWIRLGYITEIKGGKRVSNGYKLLTNPTPYVYIRVSDMKDGTIDESDLRYIDEDMRNKISQYVIHKDDIYMTIVGATIGKCGIIPEKLDGMNLTENAAKLILFKKEYKFFVLKCLNSELCQGQFIDKTKQVGVQKMAINRLASTLIPLPPLPEQHRIVEKVDRLMVQCDRLEKLRTERDRKQTALLNAIAATL